MPRVRLDQAPSEIVIHNATRDTRNKRVSTQILDIHEPCDRKTRWLVYFQNALAQNLRNIAKLIKIENTRGIRHMIAAHWEPELG